MSTYRPGLPYEPLLRLSGCEYAVVPTSIPTADTVVWVPASQTVLAELIGVHRQTVSKWSVSGVVPYYAAERACDALHIHPCEVWGDEWIDAVVA